MAVTNVQFTVAAHIMAALAFRDGEETSSALLAQSVNANPSFVRKSLSKLAKAGLVRTTRGKNGASQLARSPKRITLLDIYKASASGPAITLHSYPARMACPVSCNFKECMAAVLKGAQSSLEKSLAKTTLASMVAGLHRSGR
jgi:Rrf2 family protein